MLIDYPYSRCPSYSSKSCLVLHWHEDLLKKWPKYNLENESNSKYLDGMPCNKLQMVGKIKTKR
jgi:hypothetical protein